HLEEEVEERGRDAEERDRREPVSQARGEGLEEQHEAAGGDECDLGRDRDEVGVGELDDGGRHGRASASSGGVLCCAASCFVATLFWRASTEGRIRSRTSFGRTPIQTMRTMRTAAAVNSLGRTSVRDRFSSLAKGFQKTRWTSVSM